MVPKHPYNPGWSWGNVISIVAIVIPITISGLAVYVLMRVDAAVAEEKIVTLDAKVSESKAQNESRFTKLEGKVEDLSKAAEEMRVMQAMMAANLEMLVRSQGLRPIDRASVAQPRR